MFEDYELDFLEANLKNSVIELTNQVDKNALSIDQVINDINILRKIKPDENPTPTELRKVRKEILELKEKQLQLLYTGVAQRKSLKDLIPLCKAQFSIMKNLEVVESEIVKELESESSNYSIYIKNFKENHGGAQFPVHLSRNDNRWQKVRFENERRRDAVQTCSKIISKISDQITQFQRAEKQLQEELI